MKIYIDGDSWTHGAELENKKEERYSKIICDKLGAEEYNIAKSGGSNDRIVRNLLVENNIEDYDLAIIQLTFPIRTEFFSDKEREWKRVNPKQMYNDWVYIMEKNIKWFFSIQESLGRSFPERKENFWKGYFTEVANETFFHTKEKIQYITIKNHCEVKKVPLVLCTMNTWTKLPFDVQFDFKELTKLKYGHPDKKGHHLIANMILDKV